jgi:hypothetical protein
VTYLACIAPPPIQGPRRKGGLRCVGIFRRNVARGCGEKWCFDTVHRGLDHRVTVCFWSAIGFGNSNRAPLLLKHDVDSRESSVFEMSESPRLQMQGK